MKIIVRIKDQYGQQVVIPVCADAQSFAAIAGTRTLTPHTIRHIKLLGYAVTVQQEAVTL